MSDIRKLLDIISESSASTSTAGAVASVPSRIGETQKRVEDEKTPEMPNVIEYGNWENSALTTSDKLKKERKKASKVVKSIYGEDVQSEAANPKQQAAIAIAKKKEVAEGKFTVNAKTGAKLDPRTGAELPRKEKPLTMKDMFSQPKSSAPKLTLDDVWREFTIAASNVAPDIEPYEDRHFAQWLKNHGITGVKIGEILDRAAKKHGYDSWSDYSDSIRQYARDNVAEGSEQVFKVVAVSKSNALEKPTTLNVKASSLDEVFERLAINDWYPLEINGIEVIKGKRLKQGVAEGYNLDSHIKQTRDRILKYKDWNTTGSHDKKIKELQDKLKELLAQKKQGVAEGYNDISVGDYVSYDDGSGTDRWEVVSIEGNRVELRNDQGGTTFADINDVLKEQGVAEGDSAVDESPMNLFKNIKRVATGKDIKSRIGQEIDKATQFTLKGDHKTALKHFTRFDKLDKLANKDEPEHTLEESDLILNPASLSKLSRGLISQEHDRTDHEVEMAKSDLYQAGKNAVKVYELIKDLSEEQGLEGWVQEKIIKAADYLNTVREYLEGKEIGETKMYWDADRPAEPWNTIDKIVGDKSMPESADGVGQGTHMFLEGISQEDLADVLCNRLERRHPDIYKRYDYDTVYKAVDDVASFHAGAEELGSSDISSMIGEILKNLENSSMNEGKPGLWANIHDKRERIKSGSGERMRKPGSKGAPSAQDFKDAAKTSKK